MLSFLKRLFWKKDEKINENIDSAILIVKCINRIKEIGLETEGLYRVSGNVSAVKALKTLLNSSSETICLDSPGILSSSNENLKTDDQHILAQLVKSYIRDGFGPKSEPICTLNLYDRFMIASSKNY